MSNSNLPEASMKFASGRSSFALVRSLDNLGMFPPSLFRMGHLSCAYMGHCNRKCSGVSLGCPHAGHLGLSTLLNLCRYRFSGACPTLSWNMRLAVFLEMSFILMYDRYFCEDGVARSWKRRRRNRGDLVHEYSMVCIVLLCGRRS